MSHDENVKKKGTSFIKNFKRKNTHQKFLRLKSDINVNLVWPVSLLSNLPLASIWKVKVVQSKKLINKAMRKKS